MADRFRKFAHYISSLAGAPTSFAVAVLTILVWSLLGPMFHYSDTWQLVINTGTTIVTFLMVFLIQNTQNRDSRAIHLKLDELIRANRHARNQMIDLEDMSETQLDKIHEELCQLTKDAEERMQKVREIKRTKAKSK